LLVDGSPVATGPGGEFRVEVPAGLLPRTVRVQATDELGNTAESAMSVVAPLDYRRLPWIAIVVALTLAAAVMLYLRVPRPAAARLPSSTDEGTLEEID
ncbi:MAG TPA: hypothetical protein VHK28_03100, partial [Candidatus Limnocylindria bacterium]|nr:hypothetical protein [Candidatus Limnocylindria bacterium]